MLQICYSFGMAIIELHNVSKNYQMGKLSVPAVKDVSFSINKGEFAAISGPSGSGKSTLLNMIGLIDLPSAGNITLDGIDVYSRFDLPEGNKIPKKLDSRITQIRSSHLNVYENVELPLNLMDKKEKRSKISKKEKEEWISYLIETVGLTAWKNHKPAELSGGQRQRVAIARALVTKAPVILADEPTANLDSKNGEQILELMQNLNRELSTTFIFSTHDSRIVEMCNHVIYIFDGQKIRETN